MAALQSTIAGIDLFHRPLINHLFPDGYDLLPGTSQIYELELALGEFEGMSPDELRKRGAYFWYVAGQESRHFQLCSNSPLQVDKTTSARRKSFFEANLFKTAYTTHGLFPYRGKFHPQMIKAIMNIIGLRPGDTVLDPMMGSGTVAIEARLQGFKAIGVDASPFCRLMANAKAGALGLQPGALHSLQAVADDIYIQFDRRRDNGAPTQLPLFGLPKEVSTTLSDPVIAELLTLCYLDARGYGERRKTKTARQLFPVVLERYIAAVENFAAVRDTLHLSLGEANVMVGDARDLCAAGIEDQSIDGIVFSPPYSFAIDYIENDESHLTYLSYDVDALRQEVVGVRGNTLQEKHRHYMDDMERIFKECARVLKPQRYCVVVVGTNSNQLKKVLGTESEADIGLHLEFERICAQHGLFLEGRLVHPIEGIRNVMRDECILFFRKEKATRSQGGE